MATAKTKTKSKSTSKKTIKKTKPKAEATLTQPSNKKTKSKNIGLIYKCLALSFVAATLVLSVIIFFVSSAKTVITLKFKDIDISSQENIEILLQGEPVNPNQINGKLLETTIDVEDSFVLDHGEMTASPAIGRVTLINNYSKNQPLIATTRLLSEDGVLFRLKETVTVPAGGQIETEIYADQTGLEGEIEPGKFIIPGLWEGLQNQIYAVSDEPTTSGNRMIGELTQDDVDKATEKLQTEALDEGLAKLNLELAANGYASDFKINPELVSQKIISQETDAKLGDQISNFTLSLSIKLNTVAIDENEIFEIVKDKLQTSAPDGYGLNQINEDGFEYSLEEYDYENGKIFALATLSGKANLESSQNLINKDELISLTESELDSYFENKADIIEKACYDFSPFWLKHSATNKDKINIVIAE